MHRQIQLVAVLTACTLTTGCYCGPGPMAYCSAPAAGAHLAACLNTPLFGIPCGYPPCHPGPTCCPPAGYCSSVPSCAIPAYPSGTAGDFQSGCGEAWYPASGAPYPTGAYGSGSFDSSGSGSSQGLQQPVPSAVPPESPVPDPIGLPGAVDDASAFDTRGVRRTGHAATVISRQRSGFRGGQPDQGVQYRGLSPTVSRPPQVVAEPPLLIVPTESL